MSNSGSTPINIVVATLYKSLGIDPKTVLALAAVWGTCAFISNVIAVNFLPDRLGRRKYVLSLMLSFAHIAYISLGCFCLVYSVSY